MWTDGWDGYPEARRRLLEAVAARGPANPVVIGGDVHAHWVADLKPDFDDPRSPVVASEFCGTSITSRARCKRRSRRCWRRIRISNTAAATSAATCASRSHRSSSPRTCARWSRCRRATPHAARSRASSSKTAGLARRRPRKARAPFLWAGASADHSSRTSAARRS